MFTIKTAIDTAKNKVNIFLFLFRLLLSFLLAFISLPILFFSIVLHNLRFKNI